MHRRGWGEGERGKDDGRALTCPPSQHSSDHQQAPYGAPGGGYGGGAYGGGFGGGGGGGFGGRPAGGNNAARIYVGSVAFEVPVETVRKLFESFGPIRSCQLLPDPNNPSRVCV